MRDWRRHRVFNAARFLSIVVSVMGVLIFGAADSVEDTMLMALQIGIGLIVMSAGVGFYYAFKYLELYWKKQERKMRYVKEEESKKGNAKNLIAAQRFCS